MVENRYTRVRRVFQALALNISGYRAYRTLKTITLYHRIQGSRGLVDAVSHLERILLEEAPDNVEVNMFKYTGRAGPEWLNLPAHWEVYDAWIEVQGEKHTLKQHPTLAAAHTPPSDGTISGEVVWIRDPLDERKYEKNRDKIIMVSKQQRVAYRLAAENGVPAVIIVDESKHHDSYPYYGLFLTSKEAEKYSTVAVTLPWKLARSVEGKHVELRVDSDIGGPGELPVLVAWIGDSSGSGPTILAHICHPSPGANDNASGSSAAVEAFLSIAEAVEDGILEWPMETIRLVLLPEYTGSILSMEGWLSNHTWQGLNLDMVGRIKEYSTHPRLLYTPVTVGPSNVGDTYYDVVYASGLPTPIEYYMAGSDHDVLLGYGRDAVIVNQWPDKYYHTDSDDADTISIRFLEETAVHSAATTYLLATGYEPSGRARRLLVDKVVRGHVARGDYDSAKLAENILSIRYGVPVSHDGGETGWKPMRDDRLIKPNIPVYAGLLSMRLELGELVEFTRRLDQLDAPREVLSELLYAGRRGYTVQRLQTEIASVYGVGVAGEKLPGLIELLEEYKVVSTS